MASETALTERIKKALIARGAWLVKFHGTNYSGAGIPDLLVCYRGHFVAIEVKLPGGDATKLQAAVLRQIGRAGGVSTVATSKEEALAALDQVDLRVDGEPHTDAAPDLLEA